jgi:hypothetical protein
MPEGFASTELAFTASQDVQPPDFVSLGRFLASPYERIRLLAYCSEGDAELTIRHIEGQGVEGQSAVGRLDQFILIPGSEVSQVYEVPGVILDVSARATVGTTRVTVWVWGFRTGPPPETNPLDEFLPAGALTLSGVSATGFNPGDAQLAFDLADAGFGEHNPSDTVLAVNGQLVPDTNVTVGADSIVATGVLIDGKNVIHLASIDDVGRPLYLAGTVWAGTSSLHVSLINEDGTPFLEETTVRVSVVDDQAVSAEATTNTGSADFSSVPASTVLIEATASGNRIGALGVAGNVGTAIVALLGFGNPSTVANNDFSQGIDGWNIGSAPVKIVPHNEGAGPAPGTALIGLKAPPPAPLEEREQRNREAIQRVADVPDAAAIPLGIVDNDLQLGTAGEGARFISRTFQTDPDVSAVRLRYRFVTEEVPGGYFGSQFDDYFSVSIRSQQGGGSVFDVNSMNGLGLGAFDAAGSTAWRDATLKVDVNGDVIKVDIGVANVFDALFDSKVVVDFVEEVRVRVIPTLVWNNTQGGLDLRYTVDKKLPESRDIVVSFANGPGYGNRIGAPVFTHNVPKGTEAGQYGPVHVPGNTLGNDPGGTTHLVAASTPANVGALADVQIGFGPEANAGVVSPAMLDVVKDGLRAAGQANATISSTARTPADQARAMFNNLTNPAHPIAVNVANQLALYLPPGGAVINVFAAQTQGMTPQQIQQNAVNVRAAMEQEVNNQGPPNVSRHCADPNQVSVVDVSAAPFNANNAPLFIASVQARTHFIDERQQNNCFHLEL